METNNLRWCFLLATTFFITINGQGIPESPCPQYFRYDYYDRWYGRISVPTPEYGSGMRIRLKMQIGTGLPSAYVGRIELIDSKEELESKLYYGGNVNFRVHFPLRFPIPTVDRIRYNGRLICDGPPIQSLFMTNIHLNYDLTPNNNNNFNNFNNINNNFENINNEQHTTPSYTIEIIEIDPSNPNNPIIHKPITRPQFTSTTKPLSPTFNFTGVQLVQQENNIFVPKTTPQPAAEVVTPAPLPVNVEADVAECGLSKRTLNPLIVGGTSYPPGEWPWLAALYHKNSKGVTFACSGSLLSSVHIVTAAHCVLEINRSSKKSFSIVARLGAHNLQDWADPNDRLLNVIKIEVHPDFNKENLQNDIAMLSVNVVEFTDFIKPICIWDGDLRQEELVGKKGKVVGWGRDENGQLVTTEPRLVNMPIVTTETCRSSNPEFVKYTSENTLCAGNRDGLGPCNGDSGGGMYLPMNRRWYIRGIVSNSIKDPEDFGEDTCTLRNYVIFTDAAKYVTWMKSVMKG